MKDFVLALVMIPLFPCLPVFLLFDMVKAGAAHWLTLGVIGAATAAALVATIRFLHSIFARPSGSGSGGLPAGTHQKGIRDKIIRYGGLYTVLGVFGHVVSNMLFAWYGSYYRDGFLDGFYSAISERSRGGVMFLLLVSSIVFYLGLVVYIVLCLRRRRAREE